MTKTISNMPITLPPKDIEVSVWDPLVRIFHWSLLGTFFIAYMTEDDLQTIHNWAGYTILALLIIRIIWGFIGTKHARFSNFIFSPKFIIQYLKETLFLKAKRYLGHNPAGGAMVIMLMMSLLITIFSGLILLGIESAQGPFAPWLYGTSHYFGELFEALHEFFANFTVLLIVVHVAGVLMESIIHSENLITSMINGKKRSTNTTE